MRIHHFEILKFIYNSLPTTARMFQRMTLNLSFAYFQTFASAILNTSKNKRNVRRVAM